MGKFKSPTKNHNSTFNTSKGASVIQNNSLIWSSYLINPDISASEDSSPNSRCSGVNTFQYAHQYCDFTFCNVDFTKATELLKWLPQNEKYINKLGAAVITRDITLTIPGACEIFRKPGNATSHSVIMAA